MVIPTVMLFFTDLTTSSSTGSLTFQTRTLIFATTALDHV